MTPEISGLSRFRGTSHEQCGLITKDADGKFHVVPVRNDSDDPEAYHISEESISMVRGSLEDGITIVGILHTHLVHHPPEPSQADWEGAENNPGLLHAIYKPSTGQLTWYSYEAD